MNPGEAPWIDPDSPLARIASARGHFGQLYQYAAVLAGLKPVLDDWIRVEFVDAFRSICKDLGMAVAADVVFQPLRANRAALAGADRLCTTFATGLRWVPGARYAPDCQLHVFVGREVGSVMEALRLGWYPVAISSRVVEPLASTFLEFGHTLGYPDCCLHAFQEHNDWHRSNSYEAAKVNTRGSASRLTNPFGRHTAWSYIFHLPCSFDCPKTIGYASNLRTELLGTYPKYVEQIDAFGDLTFLVMNENRVYGLEGADPQPTRVHYRGAHFLGGIHGQDVYGDALRGGDELLVAGDLVVISSRGKTLHVIETRSDCLGPESPMLIRFG